MDTQAARLARTLRQLAQSRRAAEFSAEACSFGPQRAAILSKHKRKVKVCGRRSGKTVGDAIELMLGAIEPPIVPELYVTLTRGNAKEIIWPDLVRLNAEYQLGFKIRDGDLELISPIGVKIQLRGAHTAQEIEKYRGKKFKKAIIDEAGSFPDRVIRPLIQDVIRPALTDYDGSLTLTGSPPVLRRGFFYECWKGKLAEGREQHHWTVKENERFPAMLAGQSVDQILADICKEFGWTPQHPTFRREYLGEDVEDREALLFEFGANNVYTELPKAASWRYVLAWDLGWDDNMAVAVLGWPQYSRTVYVVDEWSTNHVDITDAANEVKRLVEIYHPQSMVIDQGALGKLVAEEVRRRHQLPVKPADKAQKGAHIALLNTALRKSELKALEESVFAEECALVRKDPEALANGGKLQELPASKGGFHGNMTDAVLYGWRECRAYFEDQPPDRDPNWQEPTELMKRALAEQKRAAGRDPLDALLGF
jgi:hypothetical protein